MKELLSVIIFLSLFSCSEEKPVNDVSIEDNGVGIEISKSQFESSNFELGKARLQVFQDTTQVFGKWKVANKDIHSILSKIEGQVARIYVSPGATVKRGDPLFYIKSTVLNKERTKLLQFSNAVEYAEKEVKRLQVLVKDTLVPLKELTAAQQALQGAVRDRESQENMLKQWTDGDIASDDQGGYMLRSPINGQLTSLNVNQGAYIEPHDVLSQILGKNELMVEIPIWEKYISSINIGDTVLCYSGWDSKLTHHAVLASKAPVQENPGRVIFLGQPVEKLNWPQPGASCEVHLPLDKEQLWVVPNSAVIRKEDGYYILRRAQGEGFQFVPENVEIIQSDAGQTAIRNFDSSWNEMEILVKGGYFIY